MVKNQSAREVSFNGNAQQMVYGGARAEKELPYHGTRISDVEEFEAHSNTGELERVQYNELEKKVLTQIKKKARALKADAYEIISQGLSNNEEYIDQFADEDIKSTDYTYSALFAAIFYRKN